MPPAGGGLIILPKKSWNVWNRDNVERVERDEAAHAAQQRKIAEQQAKADAEARMEQLKRNQRRRRRREERSRLATSSSNELGAHESGTASDSEESDTGRHKGEDEGVHGSIDSSTAVAQAAPPSSHADEADEGVDEDENARASARHFNFFESEEEQALAAESARLKALEEFNQKHAAMKKMGIAPMQLAQSSAEASANDSQSRTKPWYQHVVPAASSAASTSGAGPGGKEDLFVKDRHGRVLQGWDLQRWQRRQERHKRSSDPACKFQASASKAHDAKDRTGHSATTSGSAGAIEFGHKSAEIVLKMLKQGKAQARSKKRKKDSALKRKKTKKKKKDKQKRREKSKKNRGSTSSSASSVSSSPSTSSTSSDSDDSGPRRARKRDKSKKSRKHGRTDKRKDSGKKRTKKDTSKGTLTPMELLRRQRLLREEAERARAVQRLAARVRHAARRNLITLLNYNFMWGLVHKTLLCCCARLILQAAVGTVEAAQEARRGFYHSQFNPATAEEAYRAKEVSRRRRP